MYKKYIYKTVLFFTLAVFLATGQRVAAQRSIIEASIDSAAILIGEQTMIRLTVTTDKDRQVVIPLPQDTLMMGVELLGATLPDSSIVDGKLVIKQNLLITSFDSALYLLPPFRVIDRSDTVYSNRVALKVSTLPVDVSKPDQFYDIKPVWAPPFFLSDYYPFIFGVLFALLFVCIVGYIVQRIKQKKSLIPFKKPEPKLPPHEQAIRELDEIKQQKLWQQGRNKEYYTQVTDVLRKYIEERFGISAMEMTSGEILEMLRAEEEAKPVFDNLKQVLELADFVKFAKLHPLPEENQRSMANAYLFVERTKAEAVLPADSDPVTDGPTPSAYGHPAGEAEK